MQGRAMLMPKSGTAEGRASGLGLWRFTEIEHGHERKLAERSHVSVQAVGLWVASDSVGFAD